MKKIIICDIDGTLAFKCDRRVYDFSLAENDKLNKPIAKLLGLYNNNYGIVIITGREEYFRDVTEKWLNTNSISYISLFMRTDKDNRSQEIVKKEIFLEKINPKFDVELVIDDNDIVIQMWKKEFGLTCLKV